jgi:pyruvate formate lyase activating enzyme
MEGAKEYSVDEIYNQALRYKNYWGSEGGITITGGEPLFQMDFAIELLKKFHDAKIHTAVDTSGFMFNPNDELSVSKHEELIKYADLFLLDIKHIDRDGHKELTGQYNDNTLAFAKWLSDKGKHMWIRHVLTPGITTDEAELRGLKKFLDTLKTVDKVEVLPYHTLGITKYKNLGINYPLLGVEPPTKEQIQFAKDILGGKI